jgi:hypothetical protein
MADERTYTAYDVAKIAGELRDAAGTEQESFSREQVVSMLGDEVRLLRERGFTDERIAGLFSGFDVEVNATELDEFPSKPAWE